MLEREVRANLVYRDFTRVGGTKMPDAKTMGKWGVALGPEVINQIHERIVQIARDHRVAQAGGCASTPPWSKPTFNIRPIVGYWVTGCGCSRTMKKITKIAGAAGATLRDRSRSVKLRVLEIARAARAKGRQNSDRLAQAYQRLLEATGRVVGQAKRFASEIDDGVKRAAEGSRQGVLEGLHRELESMGAAGAAGHAPNQSPRVCRRYPRRRQDRQPVRTHHRGHSQRQGRQANRIRQNGQTAGGGEPDRHRLRGLRSAAQQFGHPDGCDRNPSGEAGAHAASGGRRCSS